MNKFEQFITPNLDKLCISKSNSVINAIEGRDKKYNLNVPKVNQKLVKSVEEIIKKHHLNDSMENRRVVSTRVLKAALEKIAENFGGNLRSKKQLEDRYVEILLNEGRVNKVNDYTEVISLVKSLDEKNILDDEKKGKLVDKLVKELL
jgi:hypothetical protein